MDGFEVSDDHLVCSSCQSEIDHLIHSGKAKMVRCPVCSYGIGTSRLSINEQKWVKEVKPKRRYRKRVKNVGSPDPIDKPVPPVPPPSNLDKMCLLERKAFDITHNNRLNNFPMIPEIFLSKILRTYNVPDRAIWQIVVKSDREGGIKPSELVNVLREMKGIIKLHETTIIEVGTEYIDEIELQRKKMKNRNILTSRFKIYRIAIVLPYWYWDSNNEYKLVRRVASEF